MWLCDETMLGHAAVGAWLMAAVAALWTMWLPLRPQYPGYAPPTTPHPPQSCGASCLSPAYLEQVPAWGLGLPHTPPPPPLPLTAVSPKFLGHLMPLWSL